MSNNLWIRKRKQTREEEEERKRDDNKEVRNKESDVQEEFCHLYPSHTPFSQLSPCFLQLLPSSSF